MKLVDKPAFKFTHVLSLTQFLGMLSFKAEFVLRHFSTISNLALGALFFEHHLPIIIPIFHCVCDGIFQAFSFEIFSSKILPLVIHKGLPKNVDQKLIKII